MPAGPCHLCGINGELLLSHIIPAFIFRWVRETSGNGFLRFGQEPNRRVQDGAKRHLLCETCEGRFSRWEDQFARKLFYPYVEDGGVRVRYGPWLMQFGLSVVWRVLRWYQMDFGLKGYPADQLPRVAAAERMWREYLLGQHRNPGSFQLHMLPVDGFESGTHLHRWPPTINRYFMRTMDTDVAHSSGTSFVYVKLPRFFFVGFTHLVKPHQWVGTRVHATEGLLEPRKFVLPNSFGDYIGERASRMQKIHASMSPRQRERIDETFRANVDKLVDSDLLKAMEQDVALFGDAAFYKE